MRISCLSISLLLITTFTCIPGLVTASKIPEAELFTIENGMSQTRVNTSLIDSYGFLWIGTSDGLNRYDGYKFEIFKHIPYDNCSLSQNFIRCIVEDQDSNLWVGTNFGLNFFERKTGKFKQYVTGNDQTGISDNRILSVFVRGDKSVWIKTEQFLDKLDPVTGSVTHYRHYFNSFNNNPVTQNCPIVEDLNGMLWFGSNDGLFSFDPVSGNFAHYFHSPDNPESISNNEIFSIYQDKNKELWIGTRNGLNKYDRLKKTFRRFLYNPEVSDNNIHIRTIIEDSQGLFWLGTKKGLIIFDKRKQTPEFIESLIVNKSLFPLGQISGLIMDNSGIIWVSGFQGLFKIDTKPKKFNVYNSSFNSFPALSGDIITTLFKENNELIWVGVMDYGLNMLNRKTGQVEKYSYNNPDKKRRISANVVKCIYKDHQGTIWLGTNNGIDIFDPETRTFTSFEKKYPSVFSKILKNRRILCMTENSGGDLWIGTDKGAMRFQRKYNIITSYNKIYRDNVTVEMGNVYALAVDNTDKIWIGTENGLNCNDPEKDYFFRYEETGSKKDLSSRIIYSILFDSKNTLWVGTVSGLNRYIPQNETFELFSEANGLSNNLINAILEDENQCLWISTNKGLSKFDIQKNEFTNYDLTEGLQSFEFSQGVAMRASDGEMFFGGISGFNSFYPQNLPINPHSPNIVIVSSEVFDNKGIIHSFSNGDITKLEVTDKLTFIIKFAALDFTLPSKNSYRYSLQLKDTEERWIPIGNQNSVTFINLPEGEYSLKIMGSNNDHVWNTSGAELSIVSLAPFWRTSYAYIFYTLLFLVAGYLIIQYRTQSLRDSNRILRERDIAAKEISRQKDMLSLRNKNIEDSLNYAQRIQKAMLTTPKMFKSILPNSFILHKPKDIVSGDFYWISEQDGKIFLAAADCTGHGVPGAFMSLISFELFRKIIKTEKIYTPSEILNKINSNFEEIFGNVEDIAIKDGMDLSFCVLDKTMEKLEYSGAFNPLYIVRDKNLIELKGDRYSIGADIGNETPDKDFTNHIFHLRENDMIYLFSDGYADQFGGPEGKKYKYRRLRHLFLNIHQLPLEKQMTFLDDNIEEWRGSIEQIDDILIIGIKIVKEVTR